MTSVMNPMMTPMMNPMAMTMMTTPQMMSLPQQQQQQQQPQQQQMQQQQQQQPVVTNPQYSVPVSTVTKTVSLPDGTVIQRNLTSMIFRSPIGKTLQMSPAPNYQTQKSLEAMPKCSYVDKKGHGSKLGYEKHLGHCSWKDRYMHLEQFHLKYYIKQTDKKEKDAIPLIPGSWVKPVEKTTPKRKDAHPFMQTHGMGAMMTQSVGQLMSDVDGHVDKDFSIEIHKPANISGTLNTLMDASVMSLAFGGAHKKIEQNHARSYYFHFNNAADRDEWLTAIQNNFKAYLQSDECFQGVKQAFMAHLHAIGVSGSESFDWKKILEELYS